MKNDMDDLLRKVLQAEAEPDKRLEQNTMHKMSQNLWKESVTERKVTFRPVLTMICALVLLVSAATAYAAANGTNIGMLLYTHIWGLPKDEDSIKEVRSMMKIISEESTFEDISIHPVEAVTDGMMSYVVVKVEGKNGFRLTEDMGLDSCYLYNTQKSNSSFSDYLLKREDNTMYVALEMTADETTSKAKQKFRITIHNLHYVTLDGRGRSSKAKYMLKKKNKDGNWTVRYSEQSIAAYGDYEAELECTVLDERVNIQSEPATQFVVSSLGVVVNSNVSIIEKVARLDIPKENQFIYVIRKDGTEIQASAISGGENQMGEFELRELFALKEPIDLEQVKGIRVQNQVYYR